MQIIGNNYTREQIYNDVFRYICEEGYHFESYGFNYGRTIYGGDILMNPYIIKKDEPKEDDNTIEQNS